MRGSNLGNFVRRTGDTMSGMLSIVGNLGTMIQCNRPDGAGYHVYDARTAGVTLHAIDANAAEPKFGVVDVAATPRLTLRADTGLLGTGLLPLSMLRVLESFASNAGAVAVLVGTTTIVAAAQLTVAVGDRILLGWQCAITKGGVAGATQLFAQQNGGTGTVLWYNNAGGLAAFGAVTQIEGHVALTAVYRSGYVEGRATAAGTVTLELAGSSAGSNSTVAIGDGQIHVEHLRG